MNFSNALMIGVAGGTGYAVGAHSSWVDIARGVALVVGLIGLWLCAVHEPKPKK